MTQRFTFSESDYNAFTGDICSRFARLISQLGFHNQKGTTRYNFEVDFMYALNEIRQGPVYLRGKMLDQANAIVNNLANYNKLKTL